MISAFESPQLITSLAYSCGLEMMHLIAGWDSRCTSASRRQDEAIQRNDLRGLPSYPFWSTMAWNASFACLNS